MMGFIAVFFSCNAAAANGQYDQTLYFVAETKDTGGKEGVNLSLLRPLEQLKIECGKRHFKQFEEVRFRVVKSLTELIG